jgi:uncharacterized membrane protein
MRPGVLYPRGSSHVADYAATWQEKCGLSFFTRSGSPFGSGSKSRFAFDPFPYQRLSTVVLLESIFLSLFILMSQNRSNIQADQRNHLDLQINLLSEEENTKMLQMLQAICEHHKLAIGRDPETTAMAQRTEISDVLSELQEHLPSSE